MNGLIQRSGRRGQRATHAGPVCLVLQGQVCHVRNGTVDRKICCFDLTLSSLFVVAGRSLLLLTFPQPPPPVYLPNSLSTLPSSIVSSGTSQFLIVQAEPLALFKICIRMLFLYGSKRRHVECLLNCSANRWRFSRCLYEIK